MVALSTADYGQYSVTGGWDVGRGRLGVNTNAADLAVLSASVSPAATDRGGGGGGRTVDLLGLIDPKRDVVQGNWIVGPRGEWACDDADGVKKIRSAYRPPAEYDYTVDFTVDRVVGAGDVNQFCCVNGRSFQWMMGTFSNTQDAFEVLGGKVLDDPANPTITRGTNLIVPGREYVSTVQVRRTGITAILDRTRIATYPTNTLDLSSTSPSNLGCDILGLSCWSAVHVHRLTVVEIAGGGVGQVIRRLPAADEGRTDLAPPPGKGRTVGLTSLSYVDGQCGWDWIAINGKPDGEPLQLKLAADDQYIFAHAPSSLIYQVPAGCVAFRGQLANEFPETPFRCMVYVDGTRLWCPARGRRRTGRCRCRSRSRAGPSGLNWWRFRSLGRGTCTRSGSIRGSRWLRIISEAPLP